MVATTLDVSLAPLCSSDVTNTSRHNFHILANYISLLPHMFSETPDDLRLEYCDNHRGYFAYGPPILEYKF